MAEDKFPMVFTECPLCKCKETVAQLGFKGESTLGSSEVYLEMKISPLINLASISVPTIPCLIRLYDDCAKCGISYCTKVLKQSMPADMVYKMMGIQPQILKMKK